MAVVADKVVGGRSATAISIHLLLAHSPVAWKRQCAPSTCIDASGHPKVRWYQARFASNTQKEDLGSPCFSRYSVISYFVRLIKPKPIKRRGTRCDNWRRRRLAGCQGGHLVWWSTSKVTGHMRDKLLRATTGEERVDEYIALSNSQQISLGSLVALPRLDQGAWACTSCDFFKPQR